MTPAQPPPPKKPWPMRYVVISILVFIALYTYINIRYRKPGPEFEPYHDIRARIVVDRLLGMGFQRVRLGLVRPADPLRPAQITPESARTAAGPGGLPVDLRECLLDQPVLPARITAVVAGAAVRRPGDYLIQFICHLPDNREQPLNATLYARDGHLYLVPNFEKIPGGLLARTRESVVLLNIPTRELKPGRYQATLIGAESSRTWELTLR